MAATSLFRCSIILLSISFLFALATVPGKKGIKTPKKLKDPKETWGYVNLREHAYMFWWLYYYSGNDTSYLEQPLVLWLQGGPGSSSTGYGNFVEIGPLDVNLTTRDATWVKSANILFVDNPVGTGYSYVTNLTALTTNNSQIADDMMIFLANFFQKLPEFQKIPFYIFCESYGGKMTSEIAYRLNQAIAAAEIPCTFKGIALGDSWISGLDSVLTWGPYLYGTSMVDSIGLEKINDAAQLTKAAVDEGRWLDATVQWSNTETVVDVVTHGINFYNILLRPDQTMSHRNSEHFSNKAIEKLYNRHVGAFSADQLSDLMNGPIRDQLQIIPENVTWGGQSDAVFNALSVDFMKPVADIVEALLNETTLQVAVYNAQLDLIVDTLGTLNWVGRMKWPGMSGFQNATRKSIPISGDPIAGYVKTYKNFAFYWMLNCGHMVPTDNPWASVKMLEMITKTNNVP